MRQLIINKTIRCKPFSFTLWNGRDGDGDGGGNGKQEKNKTKYNGWKNKSEREGKTNQIDEWIFERKCLGKMLFLNESNNIHKHKRNLVD